jgi:cell filamentation protein
MMSKLKISIRFFDDREVRAVWDEQNAKWWFRVLDGSKKNDPKNV